MNLQKFKKKALKNPKFKKEYEKYDLAFEVGQSMMNARVSAGYTQKELAELLKTEQPSIARLENGKRLPSLRFLQKIGKVLKMKISLKIS